MLKKIISSYKSSLFEVDSKNLTQGSKASLIVFIIIVFTIIFSGIQMQQSYIQSPTKKFGYKCISSITKNKDINTFNSRDMSKGIYSDTYVTKYWTLKDFKYNHYRQSEFQIMRKYGTNILCQDVANAFLHVANDSLLKDRIFEYDAITKALEKSKKSITLKENEYSSMLLEEISHQEQKNSILSSSANSVKSDLLALHNKVEQLNIRLDKVDDLTSLKSYLAFKKLLDTTSETISEKYKKAQHYYKFEYTLNIFLFLLPTWLLFYVAYKIFKKKSRHILAHLSVHVANVSALYIAFYLVSLIYDVIPKIFLKKIIAFFTHYNMTIFLNITAIIIFMAIFGLFIYRIQRNKSKEFSQMSSSRKEKVRRERIRRDNCVECGKTPKLSDKYCAECGHDLYKECSTCKEKTGIDDRFCRECGESTT